MNKEKSLCLEFFGACKLSAGKEKLMLNIKCGTASEEYQQIMVAVSKIIGGKIPFSIICDGKLFHLAAASEMEIKDGTTLKVIPVSLGG
jgi:hypothetical protein